MEEEHTQFADAVSEEEEWFFTAEDLLAAARAIEPKIEDFWREERRRKKPREERHLWALFHNPDPTRIYSMLIAYAIENLCKGLLIKKNKEHIRSSVAKTGKIPNDLSVHNLSVLLEKIQFPLQEQDKELAFKLERCAVWSARYPVPRRANHKTVQLETPSGQETVPAWHAEDDVPKIKEFYNRVDTFVENQLAI